MNLAELLASVTPEQRAAIVALRDEVTAHGLSNAASIVKAHDSTKAAHEDTKGKLRALQEQLRAAQEAHRDEVAKLKVDFAEVIKTERDYEAKIVSLTKAQEASA